MERRRKRRRNNFPYRSLSNRGPSFKRNQKGLKMLCLLPHSPRGLREGGGQAGSIKQSSRKKSPPPPLPSQESQAEVTSASSGRDTKKETVI